MKRKDAEVQRRQRGRVGRVFETHQKAMAHLVGLEDSTHPTTKTCVRAFRSLCAFSVYLFLCASPVSAAEPWATYRGDTQRTGNADGKPGPSAPRVLWAMKSKDHFIASPVVHRDRLLVIEPAEVLQGELGPAPLPPAGRGDDLVCPRDGRGGRAAEALRLGDGSQGDQATRGVGVEDHDVACVLEAADRDQVVDQDAGQNCPGVLERGRRDRHRGLLIGLRGTIGIVPRGPRLRLGEATLESLLAVQERYDNHYLRSEAWDTRH